MANNKFYGYSPKNDKPTKKQGQAYSGLEKSSRAGQMTKDGTYANLGNRLDRVNPYEFRKGMDYELTQLGISVEKEFKDDKMIELKEAIRTQIKEVLLEGKKDKEKDDDDLDKEAGKGAKKGSKKLSKFDKEREAIEKHLEDLKEKKDKELERYKKSKKDKKAVDAYKKSIDLSDGDKKKLEKTAEKFDVPSKEYVAKDIPGTIKDLEKRLKAIDKDEEKAVAKLREEKNDIALTDMTREEQIRLLNIIKERGISLREGKDSIKIYYEIAKLSFLEGLAKGLKL